MKFVGTAAVLSALVASAAAHGVVTSPLPRQPGPAALAACGTEAYGVLTKDLTAPIEEVVAAAANATDFNADACHAFLCRGLQREDNLNNTHVFTPGSTVPFNVTIKVRHTGPANVSIVDLKEQRVIGPALFSWPVYANASIPAADAPLNESQSLLYIPLDRKTNVSLTTGRRSPTAQFSVKIPHELPLKCALPGECAIQWWWLGNPGTANAQTYESCVDFTTVRF
ncbi:hypothetical protein PUNSTDRAFT_116284 [Punctularia strigosozonata HHB-11173 SS5]|uniref:Uncharacterized protein n=1 Tax=Punctularia strigosozonata (strain HHB-11173) TaxID=741275 RepID=R7S2H9_PUNST|nr:uncharacterized protein PUNSTDRAFT_116284 [Punctularia strigosozonata HHB-11173 SS5]EIN04600.1 hypothetical protein PUNSTDRAFT_116284 [Punctularia strigosozonata HHB-11173 SS5]